MCDSLDYQGASVWTKWGLPFMHGQRRRWAPAFGNRCPAQSQLTLSSFSVCVLNVGRAVTVTGLSKTMPCPFAAQPDTWIRTLKTAQMRSCTAADAGVCKVLFDGSPDAQIVAAQDLDEIELPV